MSERLNLSDYQVIRKLGLDESLYDFEVFKESMLVTAALHVDLAHGEIDLALLNKACNYWVNRFVLLQSKIVRKDITKINQDKYFVKFDKEALFNFNNVELIETNNNKKYIELIENELIQKFDLHDSLLWKLKVVKYFNQPNKYTFVFTMHHSIGDGKNLTIVISLLNIIGALLNETVCQETDGDVIDSPTCVEELAKSFILNDMTNNNSVDKISFDALNRLPLNIGKLNGLHGRVEFLKFDSNKMINLKSNLKKKTNGAKLTGVLEIAFCQALRETFDKYGVNDFSNLPYQYYTLASLREKLNLKNTQMGVYSTAFESSINGVNFIEKTNNYDYIWMLGEKQSKILHKRIANNEDIKNVIEGYDFIEMLENGYEFREYNFTHALSNIGIIENTSNDVIKAREMYFFMPTLEKRFPGVLFIGVATIDNNLCWSISYNEKFFKKEFILDLKSSLENILNILALN